MTDRLNALTVVLEKDYRDDDAEWIINAIKMIKGVSRVDINIANIDSHIAEQRAKSDIENRLWAAFREDK